MSGPVAGLLARLRQSVPGAYVDLAKVLGGTLMRNVLRGVFKILVAGFLSPAMLGVVRAVYSLFKMIGSLADFGLDYALVTFVSAAVEKKAGADRDEILHTVLVLKISAAVLLLVAGNLLAPWVSRAVLGDATLVLYVRFVFLASAGQLLWRYLSSYFAAHQQFSRLALFLNTVPVMMLVSSAVLIALGRFDLTAAVAVHLFPPLVAALLWWPALRLSFERGRWWSRVWFARVWSFSRWIYVSRTASAVRNNITPLLLKHPALSGSLARGEVSAGLYGFGNDLANEVTLFTESVTAVLLPKASARSSARELARFVKRAYAHLLLLLVPLLLVIFLAKPLILALGAIKPSYLAYLPSLKVFVILYCGTLFSVVAIPMQSALYALHLPQGEAYLEALMVILLVVVSALLIPHYGHEGAAWAVFFQRLASFAILFTIGSVSLRRAVARSSP